MVGSEVSKLEELANQPGLVAPIEFTDGDNDSFIQAVQGWAASQGKETKEEVYKVGVMEAVKMSLRGIYNTFFDLPERFASVKGGRLYHFSGCCDLMLIPLFGSWKHLEGDILRGTERQRKVIRHLTGQDPLIHEYLHLYQELLYNHVKDKGLVETEHHCPPLIIEHKPIGIPFFAPFGTKSNPVTNYRIKEFEKAVLSQLDKYQKNPVIEMVYTDF